MIITSDQEAKQAVRAAYDQIAREAGTSCCGPDCGCGPETMSVSYDAEEGYNPEADLGLGCGLPTAFAQIRQGDTVVDLGSGAGNDVFVAAEAVGSAGRVIGVDMTESMVLLALKNAAKMGATNVDFRLGEIEDLPVSRDTADLVISNCVLNLVPDKSTAFSEMYRIIKPGGRFTVSDIVVDGELPDALASAAQLYAACVSGAIGRSEYLSLLEKAGFEGVEVVEERSVGVPREFIKGPAMLAAYEKFVAGGGLFSVTVSGTKPMAS